MKIGTVLACACVLFAPQTRLRGGAHAFKRLRRPQANWKVDEVRQSFASKGGLA